MSVTLKELAKAAGVSEATVSLAMNNRSGVSEATRKRVFKMAKAMGYIPSITAQSLAKQKSGLIGVITPNLYNTNYSMLAQFIEDGLLPYGYKMILASSKSSPEYEKEIIERFISFRVEGVIIYPSILSNPNPSYLNLLTQYNIPFVFLGGYYPSIDASYVVPDYHHIAQFSTEYLYARGGRKFCLIGGCRSISSNTMRRRGIRDALEKYGMEFPEENYIELAQTSYDSAYTQFSEALDSGKTFDSVITVNTHVGIAVYNAAIEHGLRVPEDLSIISCDSILPPAVCRIQLTSFESKNSEIIDETLSELLAKIEGKQGVVHKLVQYHFLPGNSTKP